MFKKNDMVVKHNNLVRVEVDDMTVVQLKIMNLIISQLSDFKNIDDVTDDDFKFQISHKLILEKLSYSKQVHDLQNEVRSLGTKTIGLCMLDKNVGTQRIWPARAFTLGHLTHNDLASVRIAKRATKSL